MNLVCILMAAGSASRFGANKLLRDFCGKPLCQWGMEAIPRDCFRRVIVVTGYQEVARLAEGCTVVWNDCPEAGISRTIRLGLEGAGDCDGALFMTADQPLLTAKTIRRLTEAFREDSNHIYAASYRGKRGNPVLFPREFFDELCQLTGDVGGSKIIKSHPEKLRLIEVEAQELLDCDTPEALQALSCPLSGG